MQIKYRVWDKALEIYVDTKIRKMFIDTNGILFLEVTQNRITLPRDPNNFIIEQWTGMRDKTRTKEYPKGKPIYVGDKVKVQYGWGDEIEEVKLWNFIYNVLENHWSSSSVEIIGNIHETSKQTSNKE